VRGSLLEVVRGLLVRTYRIRCGLSNLEPFVIGDVGYRELYGKGRQEQAVRDGSGAGARMLVRDTERGLAACVYFPDELIGTLERHPPQLGVHAENVGEFATFVEEIDHLLLLAERSVRRRPVSLFELELHANVSKYLVLVRFLAGSGGRLTAERRDWLRRRLFDDVEFCDEDPEVRQRYRDAARWAVRMIGGLAALDGPDSVDALRRFHRAGVPGKLRLIERLPG